MEDVGSSFYQSSEFQLRRMATGSDLLTGFVHNGSSGFGTSDEQAPPALQSYTASWCGPDAPAVLPVAVQIAALRSRSDSDDNGWTVVTTSEVMVSFVGVHAIGFGGGGADESQDFGEMSVRLVGELIEDGTCVLWTLTGSIE